MADKKLLGYAEVIVDGVVQMSDDSATLDIGGVKRTAVVLNTVVGYREETTPAVVEMNVAVDANFSAADIGAITNATVQFNADTGQTWTINGAWCSDPPKITQKDGKAKVTFTGPPADEILPNGAT